MKKYLILIILAILFILPLSLFSQSTQESRSSRGITTNQRGYFPFKPKHTKDEKEKLAPNAEDKLKYASFLKDDKTGIFRLMNDVECAENLYVIRVDEGCSEFIQGSSFYSFRKKEYTSAHLSDIRFKDGLLITDAVFSQNILVRLGDVSLENVALNSDGMKFLTDFVPEELNTKATKQYVEIVKGIRSNKYEYRKAIPAIINNTYAMRIVAYRGNLYKRFHGWAYDLLAGDNRSDLIVAFRIIRKDSDGTISIIWKELERKKSPKIKYERKKKVSEQKKDKDEPIAIAPTRMIAGH